MNWIVRRLGSVRWSYSKSVGLHIVTGLIMVAAAAIMLPARGASAQTEVRVPAWLEPRGLSVVDLVGLLTEAQLRDSILVFTGGAGILQYESGSRTGDLVTIRTRVSPRYQNLLVPQTTLNCLGKRALYDEWPVAVPASQARIYSAGVDVTHQVIALWHYQSGLIQPTRDAADPVGRYKEYEVQSPPDFSEGGALEVPANSGCTIFLLGTHSDLVAEFVFRVEKQIAVTVLGSQTLRFGSYIGVGDAGVLDPLQEQLRDRFVERHDKFILNPPPGAEYIWLQFPPTPVSPYSGADPVNIQQPSGGTYRLANGPKDLSVDHTVSMGVPLTVQWLDADLIPDDDPAAAEYLPQLPSIETISAPEYFVPAGISYDPCMTRGDCPVALLDQIFATQTDMTVNYFSVSRNSTSLFRVPLRQVGPDWDSQSVAADAQQAYDADTLVFPTGIFFPLVMSALAGGPEDPTGCPCGWFTPDGRMLDFTRGPQ